MVLAVAHGADRVGWAFRDVVVHAVSELPMRTGFAVQRREKTRAIVGMH